MSANRLFKAVNLMVVFLISCWVTIPAIAQADIDTGLILYYPFDTDEGGVVSDQSSEGDNNSGVVNGDATFESNGYQGGAYQFDGDGDYIRVPSAPSLSTPEFTVSAWVQTFVPAIPPSTVEARGIFGKHQAAVNNNSYWASQFATNHANTFAAIVHGSSGQESVGTDVAPLVNQWALVTMTHDETDTLRLYINDQFIGQSSVAPGYNGNGLDMLIGAGEYQYGTGNPDRFWQGLIDEVRVYNRALSTTDVTELYNFSSQPLEVPMQPSVVRIDNRQIKVQKRLYNGNLDVEKGFFIKGVVWEPASKAPVTGPSSNSSGCGIVPYGFFFDFPGRCSPASDDLNYWLRNQAFDHYSTDIPLIKAMNANTVRTFRDFGDDPDQTREILDEFYKNGIMVVMTVATSKPDLDTNKHLDTVSALKDHPAILMWSLGNEWNLNNFFGYSGLPSAILAVKNAALAIKALDTNHPVSSSLGDGINDISYIVDSIPEIDIWGLNIYRGSTFGNLFQQLAGIPTQRPYFFSEYGTDSFMTGDSDINTNTYNPMLDRADDVIGSESQLTQGAHLTGLFSEIVNHRSTGQNNELITGGFVFEFNDELWKAGNYHILLGGVINYDGPDGIPNNGDDDTSYDEYNPEGFILPGAHPDDVANEEYFGLVDADRQPKGAYDQLARAYKLAESVLYYNFDKSPNAGKVLDLSGRDNDGDIVGNVLFEPNGKKDGAYQFDGIIDAIKVPRTNSAGNSSLNVSSSGKFTLAAWYKVTYTGQSFIMGWRDNFPAGPTCQYGDGVQVGVNIYGFQWSGKGTGVNLMGGPCGYDRDKKVISVANAPINEWHHMVVDYNQFSGAKLYLDGALVAQNPGLSGYAPLTGGDFLIGKSQGAPFLDFKGLLDEIRVYDFSLNEEEVKDLFDLANTAPIASAGSDKTLLSQGQVFLDGSASFDPDNNLPISYAWEIVSKPSGSAADLSDPVSATPSITTDNFGKYVLSLIVTDSHLKESIPDFVVFELVDPGTDTDSDGIHDSVDTDVSNPSTLFNDADGSFGEITDPGDQNLIIIDDPDPNDGVRIIALPSGGVSGASVTTCMTAAVLTLTPGDEVVVTCGSVHLKVLSGPVEVQFVSDTGEIVSSTLVTDDDLFLNTDSFTFTNHGINPVTVLVNGSPVVVGTGVTLKFELPPTAKAGPDQNVECQGPSGTQVTLDGSGSSDPNNDTLTYAWNGPMGPLAGVSPTVTLPLGVYTYTLTVNDGNGGTDTDTVQVTVQDTTPPAVSVSVDPDMLWPPNHKMKLITPTVTANDICDAAPQVELTLITMDEADQTNTYDPHYDEEEGEGNTTNDIQVDADGDIYLRAERAGNSDGRVYTLIYTATDASGNSASASATVTVPHNQ